MKDMICENAEVYGWNTLSDLDLLTIVAGSRESAVALNDYFNQASCTVDGLLNLKIDGLGKATALKMKALYTLFSRPKIKDIDSIKNSADMYDYMKGNLLNLDHEEVWFVLMDNANHPFKKVCHSKGGLALSVIDVKMIMKDALESGRCCSLAMAHNHPSGSLKPSQQDIISTNKVKEACKYFDIRFLDHIIVGNDEFYSFNDNCML